jgi:hypothetical protein
MEGETPVILSIDRTLGSVAAAVTLLTMIVLPEFAVAQQSTLPPPSRIGNRTNHEELQPTTAGICARAGKDSVDCSRRIDKELQGIRRQIEESQSQYPQAAAARVAGSGTR